MSSLRKQKTEISRIIKCLNKNSEIPATIHGERLSNKQNKNHKAKAEESLIELITNELCIVEIPEITDNLSLINR